MSEGGEPKGFAVVGEGKRWKPARARIDGGQAIIASPDVPRLVAARCAWLDNPECNPCNGSGPPASRFRTGAWK